MWCNVLYLKPGTREHFLDNLARDWPVLLPRYERLYRGAYPGREVAEPITSRVAALRDRFEIADRRTRPLEPAPGPAQLGLAI